MIAAVWLALLTGIVGFGPGGGAVASSDDDAILARIDGQPVSRADLAAAMRRLGANPRATGMLTRVQAEVLEQLIDERLLRAEIERAAISVSDEDVTKAFDEAVISLAARGMSVEQFLARIGGTEQDFRSRLAFDLGINRLLAPQLTTAAVEKAFARHKRDLDGTVVRASHIVLRPPSGSENEAVAEVLDRADRIRREILRGTLSFPEAAKKHSVGPSRHQGGDLGFFTRRGAMHEEFARQAFASAKGEVSRPFVTPFGIHLLMVTAVEPGRNDLAAVRPIVEQLLAQELLRGIVLAARKRVAIEYAPGVAHFDPASLGGDPGNRRIVVEPQPQAAGPGPQN